MGKIHMGILGPLSQSIGGVTGASVKGKATLRRKSSGGVNPRTEKQVASRSAFAEASEYCREHRTEIIEYCGFKEKKGLTIWNQMVRWYLDGGRLPVPVPYLRQIQIAGNTYDEVMLWPHTGDKENMVLQIPNLFGIPENATNIQCLAWYVWTPDDKSTTVSVYYDCTFEEDVFTLRLQSPTGGPGLPIVKGVRYQFNLQYYVPGEYTPRGHAFILDPANAGPGEFTTYDIPTDAEIMERLSVLGSVVKENGWFEVTTGKTILPTGNEGSAPELLPLVPVFTDFGQVNFNYQAYWADGSVMAAASNGRLTGGETSQATVNRAFSDPVSSVFAPLFGRLSVTLPACLPWLFSTSMVRVNYTSANYNPAAKIGASISGLSGLPAWLSALSGVVITETGFAVSLDPATYAENQTQATIAELDSSIMDKYYPGQQWSDNAVWQRSDYDDYAGNVMLASTGNVAALSVEGMTLSGYASTYPDGLTLKVSHTLQPYLPNGFDRIFLVLSGLRLFSASN